ncbi:hypothetical protein B0T10DRAFT_92108 [Thelonectria olida]|uniref:BTB domain-containing protein n=1 Tax=Thelonectria olida TaxID=1576542 RepID=A0A9P8W1V2_9HYPO|nr:hypothetical protein B0T10DRAFT_92108 [Thelonectria olida]
MPSRKVTDSTHLEYRDNPHHNTSLRSDMVQKSTSETAGASTPRWRFGSALRKIGSISVAKDDKWSSKLHPTPSETENESLHPKSPDSHANVSLENSESSIRQLQAIVQRMRTGPASPHHVDAAYKELVKVKDQCSSLCRLILQDALRKNRDPTASSEALRRRDSSIEAPRSPGAIFDTRSSFSGRSLAEVVSGSATKEPLNNDAWLNAIRDWKTYLEALTEAFMISLADTYRSYERDATQEMIDALFASKRFRKEAVSRMRNASVTRVMSADPQFFPRYEIRFRNFERVKQELLEIRQLLQAGESGISPDRTLEEFPIAPRGDAILEFANISPESSPNDPALRFRVSSHMLSETSPIFARMFSGRSSSLRLYDDEDILAQLPAPPTKYICKDGTEARLYRMPQRELNRQSALEILLHAAHMHNERVPREVTFEQFVAIAECCMRYKSTSPLELIVEHRWLPQWMHKGADDMPDGLLVISYAFGLRQLFSRMSKTAILNLVDEKELQTKPWPQKIKDKVWAVRCAKVAQVHACCVSTAQEYLRPPSGTPTEELEALPVSDPRSAANATVTPLTSIPRCPKGSHWCDATNLGWLMLVYNEMNLLPHLMRPNVLCHMPETQAPKRSLAQIVDTLRRIPTAPTPVHRGVCDPSPTFRSAINDIYNSVLGLTLFDISGKSHGWALSKHREGEPQTQLNKGLGRMAAADKTYTVATEFPESIRLRIMCEINELDNLHAAAMTSRAWYETYKKHELFLMRNILRRNRGQAGASRQPLPLSVTNAEEKVLKEESDVMKTTPGDVADGVTLHSDDDDDDADVDYSDLDDDVSLYSAMTPSVDRSGRDSLLRGPDRRRSSNVAPIRTEIRRRSSETSTARSTSVGSPTTPRQTAADQGSPTTAVSPTKHTIIAKTEEIDEPPLTEEEARRILWPDEAIEAVESPITGPPIGVEGLREKFRVGDLSLAEGLEDKTLVPTGEKQLRSEHDRRVGLLKGKGDDSEESGKGK